MMAPASDDWWVIASAAAALHGVDTPPVADVDVLVSDRDAASVLGRFGVSPLAGASNPLFRSRILGRLTVAPMSIDVMAGFHFRSGETWREVRPRTREQKMLNGARLFVPSRTELIQLLTAIGRPKDIARARQLARDLRPPAGLGE